MISLSSDQRMNNKNDILVQHMKSGAAGPGPLSQWDHKANESKVDLLTLVGSI